MSALHLIGVGIGPFNLSLAALLSPLPEVSSLFFDQNRDFIWHEGMLLPESEIQVSYLKDLVTLVDPTNPYSFLAFLVKQKRLYRFLNARFKRVFRNEFNQYMHWVSHSLPNLHFNEKVEEVDFCPRTENFIVSTSKRETRSKNLVLGSGLAPSIPLCVQPHLGPQIFHSKDFLVHRHNWNGKRVVVVGGGQSGAEIFYSLLSKDHGFPEKIWWISKRKQFFPIDDSVFANELFTPNYSEHFYQLSPKQKGQLLEEQTLASDGISSDLLEAIYQRLYTLELLEGRGRFYELLPNYGLTAVCEEGSHRLFQIDHEETAEKRWLEADILILCTGYRQHLPPYLAPLMNHCSLEQDRFTVNQDFSIRWKGPKACRIYVQNAARHSHGVADPNLSLMAWRSAKIINSLIERTVYDIDDESLATIWSNIYPPTYLPKELNAYVDSTV